MDTGKPYIDEIHPDYFIRIFDAESTPNDFYWHKDKKDRIILAVSGSDWKLQFDNEIPITLEPEKVYPIPRETFHRIIKGKDNLILKIKEID